MVISLSYHICISSILNPLPCNIPYFFWFATSYCCPSFTVSMWSYHWQSRYPFASVSLQEWMYNNPWYISRYYHNYYFREWNTCLERGLSPFPSSHSTRNGYSYHQRQFSNFHGHHYWLYSHKYGVMSIDNDNTCNNDGYSRDDMIICWTNIRWGLICRIIETYGCFHSCFDSFLTTCAWIIIMRYLWSSLVLLMFFSYYCQLLSITL